VLHDAPDDERQKLPPMINLQQYYLEDFLLAQIERHRDLIDLRWSTEVTGFEQQADGVTIRARCDGQDYRLQAGWLARLRRRPAAEHDPQADGAEARGRGLRGPST
jgi:3-(3-hydroxy-phenyl)propionate hydroxylase